MPQLSANPEICLRSGGFLKAIGIEGPPCSLPGGSVAPVSLVIRWVPSTWSQGPPNLDTVPRALHFFLGGCLKRETRRRVSLLGNPEDDIWPPIPSQGWCSGTCRSFSSSRRPRRLEARGEGTSSVPRVKTGTKRGPFWKNCVFRGLKGGNHRLWMSNFQ